MVPTTPTGCRVRIKPAVGQHVLADFQADVDADDTIGCLTLLRRSVKARSFQLGRGKEISGYRLEAWDDRRRIWIEHAP
jgi:hypothetical protein